MPKVRTYEIDSKERFQIIGDFFDIVAGLKNKQEVVDFFIGLLTPSESLMMARRIQVAKMLIEGLNYETISKKLKVSYQTITKTDRWLHSGDEKYDAWIGERLKPIKTKRKERNYNYKRSLLDRYPDHRFLKELLS